jgi:hypothetical protein
MRPDEITVIVGLSQAYWPHLRLSLQTIPAAVPVVVSWYGPGEPNALPPNARLVRPKAYSDNYKRGYVLNVGIRTCTTPYALLADADFLYPRCFFDGLASYHDFVLRCYVGRLTPDATDQVKRGVPWESLFADYQGVNERIFGQIFGAHNPCVYPTRLLTQLRGYDERMAGWGGEDDDLTERTRRAGVAERRLPIIVADLYQRGSSDFPATYRKGQPPSQNLEILSQPLRPAATNPLGWGDGP